MNVISASISKIVAGWINRILLLLLLSLLFSILSSLSYRLASSTQPTIFYSFSFQVAFRKLLLLIFSGPSSWRRCSRQLESDGENGTRRPPTFARPDTGRDPSFSGCRHRCRRIMFSVWPFSSTFVFGPIRSWLAMPSWERGGA